MRIEPLPERLYDAAVRLWQDSGLTRPWNDPEADLLRAAGGGSSCVLAALGNDDALLATAMVGHDGHRGWVYYLAVDAAQRGRGLGRQMMAVCEDWVRSRGIPKIQLMVRETNRAAVGFYEHLGYADSDVVVLGRRLDTDQVDGHGIELAERLRTGARIGRKSQSRPVASLSA